MQTKYRTKHHITKEIFESAKRVCREANKETTHAVKRVADLKYKETTLNRIQIQQISKAKIEVSSARIGIREGLEIHKKAKEFYKKQGIISKDIVQKSAEKLDKVLDNVNNI